MPSGAYSASLVCRIDGLQLGKSKSNAAQDPEADSQASTDSSLVAFSGCFPSSTSSTPSPIARNPLGYVKFHSRSHDAVIAFTMKRPTRDWRCTNTQARHRFYLRSSIANDDRRSRIAPLSGGG